MRDIEYFAVVAKHGSISRAAEVLRLSQPALSKSLRRLEESMHAKIVKRTAKGVELTAVGSALLAQVDRLRLTLDDISHEAADLSQGREGHLRIGTASGLALHLIPAASSALLKEAPKVTLKITVGVLSTMQTGLRNGELDLAVATIQAPHRDDLVKDHLYDDEWVVFAAANHPLAKRKQLRLADLVQERWAMSSQNNPTWQRLSQLFGDAGLPPPSIAVESTDLPLRQQIAAGSNLLAFGSKAVARYAAAHFRIAELRVTDLVYVRRLGVLYRKDAYLSPAARRFIEILKATAKELPR